MKKYLYFALAMPLLFACSSDDLLDKEVVSNDQFAGIEKVDATFSMDELGGKTRMDNGSWDPQEGDLWGFAWLGDGTIITNTNGYANQNHNLIQDGGIFKPQTSIYVGNYYLYRPYDVETVSPQAINFTSLEEQPLAEGLASSGDAWKNLAKTAINIGDKFTNVTLTGSTDASGMTWDKAGIKQHYTINGAVFSNQTGLDLTYTKNNPTFAADQAVSGATDISYTITAGTEVGAAAIYDGTVKLEGAAKSFTYAPKKEPNASTHSGLFWAAQSNLNGNNIASDAGDAFTWATGTGYDEITLTAADEDGVSTEGATSGWFWFNSLPVTGGNATTATTVDVTLNTSYGAVTVPSSTIGDCAYVLDRYNASSTSVEWIKLASADDATSSPKTWNVAAASHNTFVNQYGNHRGKYALTVNFSTGVMNGMHIKNDAHLQKLLKYYIASGKTETDVVLNLDGDANKEFKISKISIALLQTIGGNVKVQACGTHNNPVKIIVTQEGQADLGLADKKEVPALNKVFAVKTDVYLSSDCEWTWSGGADGTKHLAVDKYVKSITNEGQLTVNATNVQVSYDKCTLANAKDATMNITQVTTVKNPLSNLGTINVGSESNTTAELRAYAVEIKNDATALDAHGTINNYGVVGVTDGTTPAGQFNNYGDIYMENNDAVTLLTSNEIGTDPFAWSFVAGAQMMGTVILPEGNPTAIVSVNNAAENGFIKYTWTGKTYATPEGNVKYNTIIVSDDITFDAAAPEVQYIEFNGIRTKVVNPETTAEPKGKLANLKGVIVNKDKSIIIEKGNILWPTNCGYLAPGATIYLGGKFINGNSNTTVYLGTWSTDQIVKY